MPIRRLALAIALSVIATGCQASPDGPAPDPEIEPSGKPTLGLMSTLPIYWGGGAEFGAVLAPDAEAGWVRSALQERYVLEPLDVLDDESLAGISHLLLAQPRPLAPEENVALDKWVRGGGRLLLFADPMLTAHSDYPLGDRRRPQDVVLLSPILRHWGLELLLDPAQEQDERRLRSGALTVAVEMAGHFALLPGGECALTAEDVLATCKLGRGRVTILADAAMLDEAHGQDEQPRNAALASLTSRAFD